MSKLAIGELKIVEVLFFEPIFMLLVSNELSFNPEISEFSVISGYIKSEVYENDLILKFSSSESIDGKQSESESSCNIWVSYGLNLLSN